MQQFLTINLGENGPATTATVTLSDEAATYGVRRASDNVVVVAAGTNVPHVGNGVYALDVSAYVAAGVAYESRLKIQWANGDVDYTDNPFTVANPTPAGHYGDLQDVYDAVGKANADRYSNIDATGLDLDAARMAAVMSQIDDVIDHMIGEHGIDRPLTTADGFAMLSQGFGLMVGARLYKARGDLETSGDAKGRTNAETWHADGAALVSCWATRHQVEDVESQILIGE